MRIQLKHGRSFASNIVSVELPYSKLESSFSDSYEKGFFVSLKEISSLMSEIPDGVILDDEVTIGCYAFEKCTGLKSIYIPNSVGKIETIYGSFNPFQQCSSDFKIYCELYENEIPYEWQNNWNGGFPVYYGVTREEYEAIVNAQT